MAPKKWIDRKTAETYSVRHRSYNDPLYNDDEAPDHVLVKVDNLNEKGSKSVRQHKYSSGKTQKAQTAKDLAKKNEEFAQQGRRENEGEAALYGITYDDSKYDYMQHLKPIGAAADAVFVARKDLEKKNKQKNIELKSDKFEFPSDMLPSQESEKRAVERQQNVPDSISGLQPDMDPRLREVLEALEDEEYVDNVEDDNEEGLFSELVKGGEVESDEYEEWDEEFDPEEMGLSGNDNDDPIPQVQPREGEAEWETAFRQFKLEERKSKKAGSDDEDDDVDSVAGMSDMSGMTGMTGMTGASGMSRATKGNSRRRRKMFNKGAMTEHSGMSMSSSALFRNKGLSFLDDKFDKIEEDYEGEEEEQDEPEEFDMKNERQDLEAAMDDFLNNYVVEGKHLYKKR